MSKYQGATVEDLQLSPALVLPSNNTAGTALRMAFERDFSILPLSDPKTRRLEGWIDIATLKDQLSVTSSSNTSAKDGEKQVREETHLYELSVSGGLRKFPKTKDYKVITPDTPLEELEAFFEEGIKPSFALVTDSHRKFVLGVCTAEDLKKFIERRNPNHLI